MSLSRSVQDYLKAILELEGDAGHASTGDLAERLGVAAPSVTGMLRRLSAARPALVSYTKHRGARLTRLGRKRAMEIVRHHRLIEQFLFEALGVPWDEVHQEAEGLEHAISESLEARMADRLGHPHTDPHGHLIPGLDGRLPRRRTIRLDRLDSGQFGRIAEVRDHDPALLRHLASLGMVPGTRVRVVERSPFGGPLTLEVEGEIRQVGIQPSSQVQIAIPDSNGAAKGEETSE
ncbi:MAG TPA: metal-dependent transcriptional regulator [Anaerolineales bacterium]|nr:metal-dependent transcriptional regulator [Anaerolineales bacterium]